MIKIAGELLLTLFITWLVLNIVGAIAIQIWFWKIGIL
jgi:hypothetical protein